MSATKRKALSKFDVEKAAVRLLARARRDPRYRRQRERDALIAAIKLGQSPIARSLLAHGVDPNSADSRGRSALWYAAHWERGELVRDLVKRGARLPDDVLMGPVFDGDLA